MGGWNFVSGIPGQSRSLCCSEGRYFSNPGIFRVSSFRFRGKEPNVKSYQMVPSFFIKNESVTREGSLLDDCEASTASFVFEFHLDL